MTLLLALWLAVQMAAPRPAVLEERTLDSRSLGRSMSYRVLLPANYGVSARRYPVLYLLHGLSGGYTDWGDRTRLATHLAGIDVIVVMPDADDSWYVDAEALRYESYVARDLLEEVDRRFLTVATRSGRAIAGLSMGGYGAIKIALRYPDRFHLAGSFSGAFDVVRDGRQAEWLRDTEGFVRAFGPPASPRRVENDIYRIAALADPAAAPYLYLDCGWSDFLLRANREFVALLQQRKIAYEYHEVPGTHSWEYWDSRLPEFLGLLNGALSY
jgi:S-formylglutathione hydrolase